MLKFIFTLPKKIIAQETSKFLEGLPYDGIIADGLIAYSLAYNLTKRVVVLTHTFNLNQAIHETLLAKEKFDLNYAVISNRSKSERCIGYAVLDYINIHNLMKTIREDNDVYKIYEI